MNIKKRLTHFAKKNWRIWYVFYIFIYLPWFMTLERLITSEHPRLHIMHNSLDDLIPFCEYFILPYILWFLYVAAACVFMYFKATDSEYRRFACSLIVGMSVSMIICMIYPNGVDFRPAALQHNNVLTKFITALWASDTPTNVFPSIHVYNSLVIHIALSKCHALADNRPIRWASFVLCILICMSTVFLKQHSTIDVMGAIILTGVVYQFTYVPAEERIFSFRKA